MKLLKLPLIALMMSLLSACASNVMTKVPGNRIAPATNDKATIVFMRSSFVAGGIGVELFEIEQDELKFVGSLPMGNKIAHQTSPGEKVYMAYGTAADFMFAHVEAGKVYYSIVRPNWGTGGFAPTPVRKEAVSDFNMHSKDFTRWVDGTKLLEQKEAAAQAWFDKNKAKYEKIYKKYWSRFQTKSDSQKNERTLYPSDGVKL